MHGQRRTERRRAGDKRAAVARAIPTEEAIRRGGFEGGRNGMHVGSRAAAPHDAARFV